VGIFSFLTGKKDEVDSAGSGGVATAPVGPASLGESAHAAPSKAVAASAHDTPFEPPDAWSIDTAALTEPAPSTGDQPQLGPVDPVQTAALQSKVIEVIKTVFDPEIPVDIYELGLIYEILVDAERRVLVKMTLTSPACPSAQQLPSEVRFKVKAISEVTDAWVEIVWEPPWSKDLMSEAAKLSLGFF
jgi:FeS assembly SUF system protein